MTIEVGSLPRRTAAQLRAFVRAQHVELERHPDAVSPASTSSSTYWRYLVRRIPLEGECVYYQTYDASGDENDWNLNIAPDAAHDWLLDPEILQALSLFSGAPSLMEPCSVKCKEGYQVIEAELSPDNALYDKFVTAGLPISAGSWWPNEDENQGEGPTGVRVGVYGVFCGDYGHGGRPEVHPFDAFWRQRHRDGRAVSISWDLGVFQDDSNRFNSNWSSSSDRRRVPDPVLPRGAGDHALVRHDAGTVRPGPQRSLQRGRRQHASGGWGRSGRDLHRPHRPPEQGARRTAWR